MELRLLFSLALLAAWTSPVLAGSLKDARVNHASGDVRIAAPAKGVHPAAPQEILEAGATVLTGWQSRMEILFPDQTLTRLGAETELRFKPGTRDLLLDRGTLLIQVPKFRGGARVHAGSLTAAVGGATFLIEHLPAKSVKIAVLEGDVRLSVDGFLGDSIVLTPGKMLITTPDVRRLPDPVDVDLRRLAQTSSLINSAIFQGAAAATVAPLPSAQSIERKIARQDRLVERKTLFPTNLVILGSGTKIIIPAAPVVGPVREPAGDRSANGTRNSAQVALDRQGAEALEKDLPLPEP